jgi:hypothetical protein
MFSPEHYRQTLRQKLDAVQKPLNITKYEDWYSITYQKFMSVDKSLPYYIWKRGPGSLPDAVASAYPEHTWHVWKFLKVPSGFWDSRENRRKVLSYIATQLNVKELADWYRVTNDQFRDASGGSMLSRHNNHLRLLLQKEYPDHEWIPWKFADNQKAANGYWQSLKAQREIFDWALENEFKSTNLDHWYSVDVKSIKASGIRTILFDAYGGSLTRALSSVYPEHSWKLWLFKKSKKGSLWDDPQRIRDWIDWICAIKNVKSLSQFVYAPAFSYFLID